MTLKEKLKQLPTTAGVYQYFDKDGKLLYIGKAKNLKNRVKSYFRFTPTLSASPTLSPRVYSLISQTFDLSWIVVQNEHDALILENSLIKQLKPKYNILLRDDKTYPYIYINLDDDFPRFEITRKIVKAKGVKYFGPYSMSASILLESIYEKFQLVQKKSCIKGQKACLFYQIGKCLAPCEDKITKKEYAKIVKEAIEFISNKKAIVNFLYNKMQQHSQNLKFEEAAKYKQKYEKIEKSMILSDVDIAKLESFDVISIATNLTNASIVRMFIRDGKLISSTNNTIKSSYEIDTIELYKRAILEFYTSEMPMLVDKIYVSEELDDKKLLEVTLSQRFDKKISIIHPKIGDKYSLCSLALQNAHELLRLNKKDDNKILLEIQQLCNLTQIPYIIEVYDNSHLQGEANVASLVVYKDGNFDKQSYKHYNLEAKDEYAQMRETLTRRVQNFEKSPPPDLWVLDGGVAQLNLAKEILQSCGANVDVVAISKQKIDAKAHRSKGKAKDILHIEDKSIKLGSEDKRLHFFQLLRDEAHRFAITYHRKIRAKKEKTISLLNAHGVGEAKLKTLLDYFETFENIKNASLEELCNVIDEKTAKNIRLYYESN